MKNIFFLLFFPFFLFGQVQIGNPIYGSGVANSGSGKSISLSADGMTIAVGTSYDYPNSCGRARVYRNMNSVWIQIGNDIIGNNFDTLGTSVCLSSDGTTLAVGAPNNVGYVKVFKNINDVWTPVGLPIISSDSNSFFGGSIDLSDDGSLIAIGSRFYSGSLTNIGKVDVYKNTNGVWSPLGNPIYGENQDDNFGIEVSVSGDGTILAVGANNFSTSSYVKVYVNSNENWIQLGNTLNLGPNVSLSSDGSTLAIGCPNYAAGYGKVRVYNKNNGDFIQIGTDFNSAHVWDQFGDSVGLSADGSFLAVGSSWYEPNTSRFGKVSLYQNLVLKTSILGTNYYDLCGESVALSSNGSILAAGSPGSLGFYNQTNSGLVRVFDTTVTLSNETFGSDNFLLYPNPVSDILHIDLKKDSELKQVIIYNNSCQIIKTEITKDIDIVNLASGTYFIEVTTDKGKTTKTFLKE